MIGYVIIPGILFGWWLYTELINREIRKINRWPTAPGKIKMAILEEKTRGDTVGTHVTNGVVIGTTTYDKTYIPRIHYEYNVKMFEGPLESSRISYEDFYYTDILQAHLFMDKYKAGTDVTVVYNPKDTSEAYLLVNKERGFGWIYFWSVLYVLLATGVYFLNWCDASSANYRYCYGKY
jgi:hypothetical protein